MIYNKPFSFLKRNILSFIVALMCMTACSKYDLLSPQIQGTIEGGIAIGRFSFAFGDFLKGDSLLQMGTDSSISLRYAKDSLAGYQLSDIIQQATGGLTASAAQTAPITFLSLLDVNLTQSTLLSQFGTAFAAPLDNLCLNGGTVANTTGNITTTTPVETDLPLFSTFQNVTLSTGMLSLQLTNNFPFALQNLSIDLLNANTGALIANIPIRNAANGIEIAATGGIGTGTINLAGKTVNNQLAYRINTFDSPGLSAGTVLLSTETLDVTIAMTQLRVKSGVAKVPAQTIGNQTIVAPLATGNAAQKFTEITFKNGAVNYTVNKTTRANLALALTFPTLTQSGTPITEIIQVNSPTMTGSISLESAVGNLASIAAQPYNQLPINIGVSVVSSGGSFVPLNETDQVSIDLSFANLEIGGAKGQFGTFDLTIPASNPDLGAAFGYLTPESKRLLFANPVMRIKTLNSFGLSLQADMLIRATGTLPGTENLGMAADSGRLKFNIARPQLAQIATPAQLVAGTQIIDKNTSNIVQFMGILPKTMQISGKVAMRSTGTSMDYFTENSRIKLGLEMDIPIKFSTENLIIRDTMTTFAGMVTPEQVPTIEYVAMDFQYQTRLPLGVTVNLATLKDSILTDVVTDILLPAADAIDANGKVSAAKSGRFEVKLTGEQLGKLSAAPKVVMVAKLKTAGTGNTPVSIFTHYDLDMGISVRIKTKI